MASMPPIIRMTYGTTSPGDLAVVLHRLLEANGVECSHGFTRGHTFLCDRLATELIESNTVVPGDEVFRILGDTPAFREALKQELAQAWSEGLELGATSKDMDPESLETMNPFKTWKDFSGED